MQKVTTHEAKTHLSQLLARVSQGEEFTICRGDLPVARLVGLSSETISNNGPRVGTITSEPVGWDENTFAPLSDEELTDWGL